jgi:Tol biopolymer transport system component
MISRSADGQEGNGSSFAPVVAVSSLYVAFESYATNLVNNDNNGARDVFLWRKTQGGSEIERVSVGPGGVEGNSESFEPSISGMGGHVAFSSNASNLVPGTEVSGVNVYLYTRHTNTIELISKDHETGKGVGGSKPSIDMNGYNIAFYSFAYTLVPDDTNNLWDIFLFSKNTSFVAQPLRRITMAYGGGERNQGTESSSRVVTPTISGNGRFITYATTATNVVPDDNNEVQDVFVYDAQTNNTVRVSVSTDGIEGDADSPIGQGEKIDISENGSRVVFTTVASNLGVPARNVVMYDLPSKRMIPVSSITGSWVGTPSISRNGGVVAFGCGLPLDKRFNSSGLFAATIVPSN